jgi:hypothetical protein
VELGQIESFLRKGSTFQQSEQLFAARSRWTCFVLGI